MTDTAYQVFDYRLRPRASRGSALGLLALSEDATIESDLHHYLPADTDIYISRVPCIARISKDALMAMGEQLDGSLVNLVPNTPVDVIAYGCTSGALVLGHAAIESAVQRHRPGVCVTNPLLAGQTLLAQRGGRRVAVLLPYERELGIQVGHALCAGSECELVAVGSFECFSDPDVVRISNESMLDAAKALLLAHPADVLFLSCTGLRVAGVLEILESVLGIPVMASNQALAWHIEYLCSNQ